MTRKSIHSMLALLSVLGLLLVTAPVAQAASTVYVRTLGDDTECNGTANEDYYAGIAPNCAVKTIQKAYDVVDAGGTITLSPSTEFAGGITISKSGLTIDINGGIVTASTNSPAFTIAADNVTIQGPGAFDGRVGSDNNTSPAILVSPGADNLIVDGVNILRWQNGIQVAGLVDDDVASLKVINNWIYNNTDSGLQVDQRVAGIVTIEGNLFQENTGDGVEYGGTGVLDATYNSWGSDGDPELYGDGVGENVVYDPWTYAEAYLDVDHVNSGDQYSRSVYESNSFDVDLNFDAENLYGVSFKFTYNPSYLTFNGSPTFSAAWAENCAVVGTPETGTFAYRCSLASGDAWDGGTVATFNFTANDSTTSWTGNGPWSTYFDVSELTADTSAGAIGGVNVIVSNAGTGFISSSDRAINDSNDGEINITGTAKYTGYVDLQGRANDSGVTVSVYDQQVISGATQLASATNVSSGGYTTDYIDSNLLLVGTTYYLQVDRALYLPTTAVSTTISYPDLPTTWQQSKLLNTRQLTSLANLVLLGGDATNDDAITINDAACVGNNYGALSEFWSCTGTGASPDVNGDGTVNVLDLTLLGGNFYLTSSPWTP